MIVTLTENADGHRRIYLNGKSSLECWIAPKADNTGWTFHLHEAVAGNTLTEADKRRWVVHTLQQLAVALGVAPERLAAVPFAAIAQLHTADPYFERRVVSPKRRVIENGFMAVDPRSGSQRKEFTAKSYASARHRQH